MRILKSADNHAGRFLFSWMGARLRAHGLREIETMFATDPRHSAPDEFLQTRVNSASPYRLHLMVVDKAIQQTRNVIEGLNTQDFSLSHESASRARDCVVDLISSLRVDPAPDLIAMVKDYFLHIQKNLVFADLLQDKDAAQKALDLLEGYRATWVDLRARLPQQA